MANKELQKEIKRKRQIARKRKELLKKVIPITVVIVVISLAIILSVVLGDEKSNNNSASSGNSSSNSNVEYELLDLGSSGCVPCDNLKPIIYDLKSEYSGKININYYDVNATSTGAKLANKYGVTTIPTLVYLKNGKEVYRSVGYKTKSQIEDDFRRLNWI